MTELRIGQVELQPPKERPADGPVTAWVVRVLETDPPAGQAPLEWLLVSSEGGPTAEWAERIVGWYEARWGIEEYFRVLKSGTRIEDRRLQEADALVKCLAFDAITAWRVCSLDRYARDAPDTPAAEVLTDDERQVIGTVVRAERLLPPAERGKPFAPDIRSWVVLLARMAGWHPSKRSEARCPATRSCGAHACSCGRWCASCKPRAHPETGARSCSARMPEPLLCQL